MREKGESNVQEYPGWVPFFRRGESKRNKIVWCLFSAVDETVEKENVDKERLDKSHQRIVEVLALRIIQCKAKTCEWY